ncbi:MAG: glycosyltransferase [Burkholderiales bacterium]|nr:glycosyltransferase [Burkholderiales bacterium]
MLGWQADPTHGFHAADIVLHPTLWEGLPLSLLEAQAASLPIVASNVKGNREVVTPDTGFLCDPRNVDQYVAALAQLINNPAHRHHLGTAGRRRAERYFDTRITSRQVGDLYDELLELPKSDPAQRSAA